MDNKNLVARLKTLQRARSKRAFARFCDLSDSTMRGYLNGKRYPVPENLEKIAKAHETTTDWLISGRMPDIRSLSEEKQKLFFEQDPEVIDIEFESGSIFPVVKAYDNESTQLHFYCIHCSRWHHHGKDDIEVPYKEGRAGHWNAHCLAENSPFKIRGIILDIVGKYSEINKTIRKKRNPLICPRCSKYYSAAFNACSCGYQNKRRKSNFTPLPELYQAVAFVIPNPELKDLHDNKEINIASIDIGKIELNPPPEIETSEISGAFSQKKATKENKGSFEARKACKDQDEKLARMEMATFKNQCPGFFDEFFEFIADEYGPTREGVATFFEDYKNNKSHTHYRLWLDEKKRSEEDSKIVPEGNINANEK